MQSLPDWPPPAGALRPSPFPHPVLDALHGLACALLFPAYWALDQLLGYWAPAARPSGLRWLSAAAGAGASLLLLLLVGLPLALPGLLLWLLLQVWRRPFCYQPPPQCWAPPAPWRPPTEPARCFGFLSANLCLLPDGLARFSNLQHGQRRAEAVGAVLLAGLRPSRYGTTGCSPPGPGAPCGMLIAAVPAGLDFVCLQEVFDLRAARRLVSRLAPNLGPVLYNVGTFGLQPGPHLKLLGSGLLLASRYPLLRAAFWSFPHGRREDALASKGLLSAQVHLGILDGRRIVGFLHCTHLHAPSGEPGRRDRPRVGRASRLCAWRRVPTLACTSPLPLPVCPLPQAPRAPWNAWVGSQIGAGRGRGGVRLSVQDAEWHAGLSHLSPALPPPPAEDGPLRCKQLTLLLDWAEQFEAESRQGDDAVAFSVLLGDLNFDNCSPDHAQEQEHQLFSRFQDPCRLGKRREQPWALGTILNTSMLCHSVACSPEMLRRALEQEEGRHRYLAGPPRGGHRAKPWRGRRLDYITYRGVPGGPLNPEVEQVTFSTALAGLTDHLAVGLRLRVSMSS
ncbi:sphingomyelin phosphodiesterase 5-like isoform X2 [Diceros bicornis minor]|uniref:sphingomyelin phosphodiesterase 5-like isoform X2 n=1 Tax=Diceros bicornis minor TaxID=77932 RepID=UPI0026F1B3F7|nr:sphingomyelin phosphodiesterase 5-like isoform X2 [Diceros bicornis minor]